MTTRDRHDDPDRRVFVTAAGGAVAAIAGAAVLAGCGGLTRRGIEVDEGGIPGLAPTEREILEAAALAPSGHNTQPWGVRVIGPARWMIRADPTRWLPAVDPGQRETLLSLGAFLENLVVAAGGQGLETEISVVADTPQREDVASVTLRRGARAPVRIEAIRRRRIVRKGYLATELRAEDLGHLTGTDPDRWHYFPATSPQGRYLSEGTVEANRAQADRDPAQEELAEWIRWSTADARRHRDGLTPEGMEITGIAGWYVRHAYDRDDVMSRGFRDRTVATVSEQVARHGGWLVLTSPDATVASLLDAGRRFERLALEVRERMIAVHPMTQMLEEPRWEAELGSTLGLRDPIQFILRAGYLTRYPEPVTLRRPPRWFVRA